MYLCLCKGVTESEVQQLGRAGTKEPDHLITALGLDADDCCGRCAIDIDQFVEVACDEWTRTRAPAPARVN